VNCLIILVAVTVVDGNIMLIDIPYSYFLFLFSRQ
jgi:hypothetical protein